MGTLRAFPKRSPEHDLAEAIGTETYARSTRVKFLIDVIEAEITYALNPEMLVANPKVTR